MYHHHTGDAACFLSSMEKHVYLVMRKYYLAWRQVWVINRRDIRLNSGAAAAANATAAAANATVANTISLTLMNSSYLFSLKLTLSEQIYYLNIVVVIVLTLFLTISI